jgi:hypothetical protein
VQTSRRERARKRWERQWIKLRYLYILEELQKLLSAVHNVYGDALPGDPRVSDMLTFMERIFKNQV